MKKKSPPSCGGSCHHRSWNLCRRRFRCLLLTVLLELPPHCCWGHSFLIRSWLFFAVVASRIVASDTVFHCRISPSTVSLPVGDLLKKFLLLFFWRCCLTFCRLSGSPGDSKCLNIFWRCSRYWGMILSSRTTFSWCEDFFIDAAFSIRHRCLMPALSFPSLLFPLPPLPPLPFTFRHHHCWPAIPCLLNKPTPPSLVLPAHFSSNLCCCWCFLPHMCSCCSPSIFCCHFQPSRMYNSLVGAPCMDNQIEQSGRIFDLRECCFLNEEWFLFFIFHGLSTDWGSVSLPPSLHCFAQGSVLDFHTYASIHDALPAPFLF